jgi:hypothetical protein
MKIGEARSAAFTQAVGLRRARRAATGGAAAELWGLCARPPAIEIGRGDRCVELDRKIAHYQCLASRFTDQGLLDGIKELIERAKDQKAALHPERME